MSAGRGSTFLRTPAEKADQFGKFDEFEDAPEKHMWG
jgi:hypothetical protein